jgi:hypothetical protein
LRTAEDRRPDEHTGPGTLERGDLHDELHEQDAEQGEPWADDQLEGELAVSW